MPTNPLSSKVIDSGVPTRPYRVVQWATGTIGTRALRAVISHPHLRLAGVYRQPRRQCGALRV